MRTYGKWASLGVIAAVLASCTTASAAMHHVRSTGTDSLTCGTSASPCRSITQAITNASDGDSISVGPGVYGDINDDGILSGTGGEEPNIAACTSGSCMIRVNKSVKISSTDGAGATVIRAPPGLNLDAVVSLESTMQRSENRTRAFRSSAHSAPKSDHSSSAVSRLPAVNVTNAVAEPYSIKVPPQR